MSKDEWIAVAEELLVSLLPDEFDPADRQALFEALNPLSARAGTAFIEQGHTNDRLWFLVEGSAKIERASQGKVLPVADLSAPGIFGATTFFRPTPATVTIRASSDAQLLTLDHPAHERLRRQAPKAAEALALATVTVLAERFDLLDHRMTEFMSQHTDDQVKSNEWARFRARLFGDPNII